MWECNDCILNNNFPSKVGQHQKQSVQNWDEKTIKRENFLAVIAHTRQICIN